MTDYNELIWADLDFDEKRTYKIYESFQRMTRTLGMKEQWISSAKNTTCYNYDRDGKYPGDKIRESKNWRYFCDIWEIFKDYPEFDESTFINSVERHLLKGEKITPARLRTKKIIQQYQDYRMSLKMSSKIDNEKQIMEQMASTYKYIKNKLKKEALNVSDLHYYFSVVKDNSVISEGILACIQEMISPFYLVISKSFEKVYKSLDKDIQEEIIDLNKYQNLRTYVKLNNKAYSFAKRLFGDDIV